VSTPSLPPHSDRLRSLIDPTARVQPESAGPEPRRPRPPKPAALQSADLALLSGHPSGLSRRLAANRLGTPAWDLFPGRVALLDPDGVVLSVNRGWREFGLANGADPSVGLGMNYLAICDSAAAEGEPEAAEAGDMIRAALTGREDERRLIYPVSSASGRSWFSLQVLPMAGRHIGPLIVHTEVPDEKSHHRVSHDPLTGLPCGALLSDRLNHAVACSSRRPGSMAVLLATLDGLDAGPDRFGALTRDAAVRWAAQQMGGCVRGADTLGRRDADSFLVIAESLDNQAAAADLAARLVGRLSEPFVLGADRIRLGVSIGIAVLESGQTAEGLLRSAEQARQAHRNSQPFPTGSATS
jgi:diguanylate cyclase (GGDEF)-like protein